MSKEIELKLKLTPEAAGQVGKLPLLEKIQHKAVQLDNVYFDTLSASLSRHGYALRIRKQGERFIQTLKDAGSVVEGLHQRNEWEVELSQFELDLTSFPVEVKQRLSFLTEPLAPLFQVNFTRTLWYLQSGDNLIEMALDQGFIAAGDQQDEVCELELELKQGNKQSLFELAASLQQILAATPYDRSKAERGYRLAGVTRVN